MDWRRSMDWRRGMDCMRRGGFREGPARPERWMNPLGSGFAGREPQPDTISLIPSACHHQIGISICGSLRCAEAGMAAVAPLLYPSAWIRSSVSALSGYLAIRISLVLHVRWSRGGICGSVSRKRSGQPGATPILRRCDTSKRVKQHTFQYIQP